MPAKTENRVFLSVVIPVFNTHPAFIQECLESIDRQSWPCPHEVIIVDDGSTNPDTLTLLAGLPPRDGLRVIHQDNLGPGAARNAGIVLAQGEYILPLDADDRLNAELMHALPLLLHNADIDVLHGDVTEFGDASRRRNLSAFHRYDLWLHHNTLYVCAAFRKSLWQQIGGYDASFLTVEDWDFWIRCAVANARFHYVALCFFDYRVIRDGQSLIQKTQDLVPQYHRRTVAKLPLSLIDFDGLNDYVLYRFQKKRRKALGLLLCLYFPKLYHWLCGKGLFSYGKRFLK